MQSPSLAVLALAASACASDAALLPIFMMHGVMQDERTFEMTKSWLLSLDPEVKLHSFHFAERKDSLKSNMWDQGSMLMDRLRGHVREDPDAYRHGYALLCHSQGALLCRTVVERMDDHNVVALISVAGPQLGVYGVPPGDSGWTLPNMPSVVFDMAYTHWMQSHNAVADYWHDPRAHGGFLNLQHPEDMYDLKNEFLPVVNNNPRRARKDPKMAGEFKANFLRLQKAVFLCSGSDQYVKPGGSGCFEFYGSRAEQVVPLEKTKMWDEDWIGLRHLNETGRLELVHTPGICHYCWLHQCEKFRDHILPHLPLAPGAVELARLDCAARRSSEADFVRLVEAGVVPRAELASLVEPITAAGGEAGRAAAGPARALLV